MEDVLINGENDRIVCYLKLNGYLLEMFLQPIGWIINYQGFNDLSSMTITHLNLITLTRLPGCVVLFSVLTPPLEWENSHGVLKVCWPHAPMVTVENTQRGLQEEQWCQTLTRTCWTSKQLEHLAMTIIKLFCCQKINPRYHIMFWGLNLLCMLNTHFLAALFYLHCSRGLGLRFHLTDVVKRSLTGPICPVPILQKAKRKKCLSVVWLWDCFLVIGPQERKTKVLKRKMASLKGKVNWHFISQQQIWFWLQRCEKRLQTPNMFLYFGCPCHCVEESREKLKKFVSLEVMVPKEGLHAASPVGCFQVNQVHREPSRKTPSPNTPNLKTPQNQSSLLPFPIHINDCPPGSKALLPAQLQILPVPPSWETSHQNGLSSPSCNY